MSAIQLQVQGLQMRFGGFTAIKRIDLDVRAGERLGVIGPNGSGKSTFVNCIAGTLVPTAGDIVFEGQPLKGVPIHQRAWRGISRTFQLPRPFRSMTVLENACMPLMNHRGGHMPMGEVRDRAARALERAGLVDKAGALPDRLTQVELRKLELAKAIATDPSLLLADEVMAGLASAEVDEVLDLLFEINEAGTTVIMIEHIMRAVTRFSERLMVIVAGERIGCGDPAQVLAMPEVERAYLGQ